jgi:hypothetical protein
MACYVHANREAEKSCAACGNLICNDCSIVLADTQICKKCLAEAESVPAIIPQNAAPFAAAEGPGIFNWVNWGGIAVPLLLGAVSGVIGGTTYHDFHGGATGLIGGLFSAFLAGVVLFCIGALWTKMIVAADVIRNRGGVLGLFGVNDHGKALTIMIAVGALFWAIGSEGGLR